MCKLFDEWSNDIRMFCKDKNYNFEKTKELSQCWGDNFLALQFHNPNNGNEGLRDETPMPLVLLISKRRDGTLNFETTEYTERYLS